jgi:hypothetical protein
MALPASDLQRWTDAMMHSKRGRSEPFLTFWNVYHVGQVLVTRAQAYQ